MAALKLPSICMGTDSWPWAIFHTPLVLRRPNVSRNQDIGLRTVGAASRQVDQRVAKRDVFAGGDAKRGDREADLASPAGEPVLYSLGIIANGLQRRSKIELNQIRSPVRHYSGGILGSYGLRPRIDHRPDLGFGTLDHDLVCHGCSSSPRRASRSYDC